MILFHFSKYKEILEMKKNDMLNEGTIRRFMKLATIDGLSDKFVDEKLQESDEQELEERGMKPKRDEEEMREGEEEIEEAKDEEIEEAKDEDLEEAKDEDEMREGADEDLEETVEEPSLEEDEMEMGMDLDAPAEEPAAGGMVSVDQLMSALEKALEDVLGQEVEVSQDDEETEVDMDMDMDVPDAGDELGLDADAEEEEEELEEATPKTDVVEEVYARVIQRLTKETKSNKK